MYPLARAAPVGTNLRWGQFRVVDGRAATASLVGAVSGGEDLHRLQDTGMDHHRGDEVRRSMVVGNNLRSNEHALYYGGPR